MRVTIRTKIISLVALSLAAIAFVGFTGYSGMASIYHGSEEIVTINSALRSHLECDMMHDALRGDVLAALLAEPGQMQPVYDDLKDHAQTFREKLASNLSLPLDTDIIQALRDAEPVLETYIQSAERIVADAERDRAVAEAEMPAFMVAFGDLEDKMESLSDLIEGNANGVVDSATSTNRHAQVWMLGTAALSALVLVGMALIVINNVVKPLRLCVTMISELAKGDLTQHLVWKRKDEFGDFAVSINRFVENVHNIISEVADSAREVAGASTQIAAASEEMATGMNEQASQVTQISSAVEEMSSSVTEVSRKASEAADNATQAGEAAVKGGSVVEATIEGMTGINEAVSASAASVSELGKRGEQIGQIIEVINDIADQTNLLALNAAIEAARAGEHGRGFAVVADEVRKLADRTTKATEEIAESIKAIQSETGEAVDRMNYGTEQVQIGVTRAKEAGESLRGIVTSSRGVADMIRSIAAAAEQQSSASGEISRNIESITAVTTQAAEGANQSATAASQLSNKAEQLLQLVGQFKLHAS